MSLRTLIEEALTAIGADVKSLLGQLSGKVDGSTLGNAQALIRNTAGNLTGLTYSNGTTVTPSALAQRDSEGGVRVPAPTVGAQATNRDYVERRFDSFEKIRYVAYGHSFGIQQSYWNCTAAGVYPLRVRDRLGIDTGNFANRTASGQRAAQLLTSVQNTWPRGDYGLVSIMITQNDAGYRTGAATFRSQLQQAIDWIRGPGEFPPTVVLVLDTYSTQAGYNRYPTPLTDAVIDTYNGYVQTVANGYPADGSVIVVDANAGWDRNAMTAEDGQHPNDRGQAHIANAIVTALAGRGFREGQNVGITKPSFFYDSFNRANSSSSFGSPMYGDSSTYDTSAMNSATYGITGNQAYRSDALAARESALLYDSGKATVDMSVKIGALSAKGMGPVWRASSINDMWVVDIVGTGAGNAKVYMKVAGTFTQVGSALAVEVTEGSTVRVVHSGTALSVYVDGTRAYTATTTTNNGANTKHGIRLVDANSGGQRLDDLIIK